MYFGMQENFWDTLSYNYVHSGLLIINPALDSVSVEMFGAVPLTRYLELSSACTVLHSRVPRSWWNAELYPICTVC
jgi:hypothetical protein